MQPAIELKQKLSQLQPVLETLPPHRWADKACPEPDDSSIGWTTSTLDPMQWFRVFKSLWMKSGFVLRDYQFQEGDNGNGFIWAMPESVPFTHSDECPRLK